ncbi:hypothetical protein MKZ38_001081 [Zalerion maritima]|uniref:FAD/NAD(P)-binding domain-containing protein n=1 Tax=Zalerion maritima TaxID=339359 RepID=A0AAD5WTB8_9PEZI|nr:hypothetical protein MKZ38_001081 [Zalerion maritima]
MENSIAFERATTLERTTFRSIREGREHTVMILGGSYAAIQIAHRLLKYARMYVQNLKVVMVWWSRILGSSMTSVSALATLQFPNPSFFEAVMRPSREAPALTRQQNTHLYWNMASVRAIIPGQTKDDDLFGNIARGFAQYATDSFVHIIGSVEGVDPNTKTVWIDYAPRHSLEVEIERGGGTGAVERHELKYDHLILCTGTRSTDPDMPWKNLGSTDETREQLHITQRKVEKAKHIVVAGGGATGVEVAAELAFEYAKASGDKRKEIVLATRGAHVLSGDSMSSKVEKELAKLGVKLMTNSTVEGKEFKDNKTYLTLRNGKTIETDLLLPTTGLIPNSEYLPERYKNSQGYVTVDEYFRVVGAPSVWAVGDIVSIPRASFVHTEKHATGVALNVENALRKKDPVRVKSMAVDPLAIALGRKRGAGRAGKVSLPSYAVYWAKGRNLGMSRMPSYLNGAPW